ncbi:hypothetical protein IQ269_17195 [Tychonema sp. LEGE 07199]|uniref:hypothetical protein n=1 Tax=unclassified Tychonema TaxID=2642144 RepID=UPI00187DEC76|nr:MULTISPECIES: hypothetical protein [unclassified Tychonema]MBE9122486.1 hypothetical protein [Tychonema sp. LEGE 07199]MBE9133613.1 hypothetical protein [Tychonema sp. LEGE 07196]
MLLRNRNLPLVTEFLTAATAILTRSRALGGRSRWVFDTFWDDRTLGDFRFETSARDRPDDLRLRQTFVSSLAKNRV